MPWHECARWCADGGKTGLLLRHCEHDRDRVRLQLMLRSYRPSGCWIDGLARRRHRAHHDRQPLPSRVEESGPAIGCRPPRLGAECVDQGRYYLARKARIQSPVDEARARKVSAVGVVECIEDHLDAMTYTSDHRLCKTECIRRIVLKALCRNSIRSISHRGTALRRSLWQKLQARPRPATARCCGGC